MQFPDVRVLSKQVAAVVVYVALIISIRGNTFSIAKYKIENKPQSTTRYARVQNGIEFAKCVNYYEILLRFRSESRAEQRMVHAAGEAHAAKEAAATEESWAASSSSSRTN